MQLLRWRLVACLRVHHLWSFLQRVQGDARYHKLLLSVDLLKVLIHHDSRWLRRVETWELRVLVSSAESVHRLVILPLRHDISSRILPSSADGVATWQVLLHLDVDTRNVGPMFGQRTIEWVIKTKGSTINVFNRVHAIVCQTWLWSLAICVTFIFCVAFL